VGVLDDGWDESVGVVFEFGLHGRGLVGRGRSLGDGLGEGKSGRGGQRGLAWSVVFGFGGMG
jgi:hypothetical protein